MAKSDSKGESAAPPVVAPARDGNVAIREELDQALKRDTIEAYDLFLARHPGHPLGEIARQQRDRLTGKQ